MKYTYIPHRNLCQLFLPLQTCPAARLDACFAGLKMFVDESMYAGMITNMLAVQRSISIEEY